MGAACHHTAGNKASRSDHLTYYRYDGTQYQSVYAYTAMGVGTDGNGNDLAIAQDRQLTRVACR